MLGAKQISGVFTSLLKNMAEFYLSFNGHIAIHTAFAVTYRDWPV